MIGINKPFSKSLHSKNDPKSRKITKEFFAKRGVTLVDHPNKFDIDLMTEDGGLRVEVEHRLVWTEPEFPFSEVNVPQRKAKFFREGKTDYVILSERYTHIGFISADSIKNYMEDKHLKESPNKYVEKDEYFYKIPKDKFEWYTI